MAAVIRRLLVVFIVAVLVFTGRGMLTPAPARADICGVPFVGAVVCGLNSVLSAASSGVTGVLSKTGDILDKATGKIIGTVAQVAGKWGCVSAAASATDGVAIPIATRICNAISKKLGGLAGQKAAGTPTTTSSTPTPAPTDPNSPSLNGSTDSPANVFRTSALASGAALFAGTGAHLLSSAGTVNLHASWFQGLWDRISGPAMAFIAGLAFLAMLLIASVRGDGAMIVDGLLGLGWGALVVVAAGSVATFAMLATDQLSAMVAGGDLHHATTVMRVFALALLLLASLAKGASHTGHTTLAHLLGTPAWFLSLGALLGTGLLMLDLAVRTIGVYLAMLVVPLAAVARIYPGAREWSTRLWRAIFALITAKLFLVIAICAAASWMTSSVSGLIYGSLLFLIVAFCPLMVYGLIGWGSHAFHGRQAISPVRAAVGGAVAMRVIRGRRDEMRRGQETLDGAAPSSPPPPPSSPPPTGPRFSPQGGGPWSNPTGGAARRYERIREFPATLDEGRSRVAAGADQSTGGFLR